MGDKAFLKPSGKWMTAGVIVLALSIGTVGIWKAFQKQDSDSTLAIKRASKKSGVISTLGRLEPAGQVIRVNGPQGERILRLLVKEGQQLEKGEIIAFLESFPERKAEVELAKKQLSDIESQARKALGKAKRQEARVRRRLGETPETRETVAQAIVRQSEVEYEKAQAKLNHYRGLLKVGAVSRTEVDAQIQSLLNQQQQLESANATLAIAQEELQTGTNSPQATTVSLRSQSQTDFASAQSRLELAAARLARTMIRAPKKGQVLKLKIREGEAIKPPEGIVEMGDTSQMYVVAQVYDTDVKWVEIGQLAKISSPVFKGEITGTIEKVGLTINKKVVQKQDPVKKEQRVVDIKIRLNNSIAVSGLTNLQVNVAIQPQG